MFSFVTGNYTGIAINLTVIYGCLNMLNIALLKETEGGLHMCMWSSLTCGGGGRITCGMCPRHRHLSLYSPLNQSESAVRIGYGRIHEQRLTLNPIESFAIALQPLASSVLIPHTIPHRTRDTLCSPEAHSVSSPHRHKLIPKKVSFTYQWMI